MQTSTSLRASTSMQVQTSMSSENSQNENSNAPPATTKYAKIQPAIAIKPKPSVIPKSTFNPAYNQQAKTSSAPQTDSLINTSRKWVLPPRPRPGRKPTTSGSSPGPEKAMQKRKPKVKREEAAAVTSAPSTAVIDSCGSPAQSKRRISTASGVAVAVTGVSNGSPQTSVNSSRKGSASASVTPAPSISTAASSPRNYSASTAQFPTSHDRVNDLQKSYLARIKEQELIKNYIDVLTKQIKQLRFVQSGVITFDVLNDTSIMEPSRPAKQQALSFELLDHINNIHDLDKHLAYVTTQLNVLHSVTKKYNGVNNVGMGRPLSDDQTSRLVLRQVRTILDRRHPKDDVSSPVERSESFTPSLLQPLRMNTLDPEENLVVDIVNSGDSLGGERNRVDESMPEPSFEIMNLLQDSETKPALDKKPRKIGCGFCTNDTPCVCFDADTF